MTDDEKLSLVHSTISKGSEPVGTISYWRKITLFLADLYSNCINLLIADQYDSVDYKGSPDNGDKILIEDSADGYAKKYTLLGDLVVGGGLGATQYRALVYEVSGGDFTFIKDASGNPVYALEELE